jgi:predicted dehydrogenase
MTDRGLTDLRAAIVGTGFMAKVHAEALRRLGIDVLGVAGSSYDRAIEQAHTAGLPTPYPSYEDLLEDERVDVVHITSPNDMHHAHALAALRAGKHVICEKPLAPSPAETAELCGEAERSGLVHAVNFMSRFYSQCQEARARVEDGSIGPMRVVSGAYLQDWMAKDTDWDWRVDPLRGGPLRIVGDIGSHWLDLVTFISGRRIDAVIADLTTVIPERQRPNQLGATSPYEVETEDVAGVLLRFEGGGRGVLTLSQVSSGRKNALSFQLDGADASLAWESERPEELWIGHRDGPNELLLRDPSLMSTRGAATSDYPGGHTQGFPDAFKALYRAVYRAVAAGGPPDEPDFPTFVDGHEQALVADAIARSAGDGRWTTVEHGDGILSTTKEELS